MSPPRQQTTDLPESMVWIRRTDERPERRPNDIVRVVVGVVVVALAALWAQAESSIDADLFQAVNHFPNSLEGLADALYALGSIWAALAITLILLACRKWQVAMHTALAGALAWGIAEGIHEIADPQSIKGLAITVRMGDGPVFPATNVAIATALVLVLAPYVIRPLRRMGALLVMFVALATMYLGAGFTSDVIGACALGFAAGGAVLAIFGAPGGRPSIDEVRDALTELGFSVASVEHADDQVPRAAVMDVRLKSGERVRVDAFGRDQRDGQVAAKLWHRVMYRDPGLPVFGSRLQQVEHIAFALMLADRAKVSAPSVVKTGLAGPEAAMLVTAMPVGRPLDEVRPAEITDPVLAGAWRQVHALHEAGISHGSLDAHHVLVEKGKVSFADFTSADASADPYWRNRDSAVFLAATALLVGNERAVKAVVKVLGKERVAELIPFVQPAVLPSRVTTGKKHLGKALKELRADLETATGAEDVPPLKVKRLSLVNIGMLLGVVLALTIAFRSLSEIDFAEVQQEFENATWGWVALTFMLYPLVPTSWAVALMGCVNRDLPFVPTVLTQLACSFLNLITPNGIGGTALQLDYLHHQDVPVASGASAMVLSTGVGGAIQMILLIIAASMTATSLDLTTGPSATLGTIALVAAVIGVVLGVPKIRGKVLPAVKRAANDIWAVIRNPKKAAMLLGGDTAGNLIYPALLGLCLLAFGESLGFAELIVVQIGAGILGNVAPVPGGIGVQEAALTAGLTGFGVPPNVALATVLTFRAVTFAIPPIFGFFTLRWLRAKGYA
jgi:uncharacterized membrane protein YbhN (UPF0104 family)/tRNA A-37 threonylcarbamoyl transferase component Bud32